MGNLYCVAHISFFDNELHLAVLAAGSEKEALLLAFPNDYNEELFADCPTLETMQSRAADCDMQFAVLQIG